MNDLINPNVLELMPYKAGRPVEEIQRLYNIEKVIKLASNENPFPIPPDVVEAITREIANIHTYPCSDSYYLREQVAQYNNVKPENVVIGAGSVELIRMIVKTFLNARQGEKVLTSDKTFVMYKIAAVEEGGNQAIVEIPLGRDYRYDLDRIARAIYAQTKIIFIANPNNPTGTLLTRKELMDFIDKIPDNIIVVLDNAYQEYVTAAGDGSAADYLDGIQLAVSRKNVIVLRTFSKIYALAGLRVGYAIADEEVISYLGRVKAPFNVSRLSQVAALASLKNDEFKNRSARVNAVNRERLFQQLTGLGLKVVPSKANFLLFFPGTDTNDLNERLLKEGVIIRPLHGFGFPDAIRVTVGTEEENDFFMEKLVKVFNEMK
ncbi:MAG TPA: histidinol-phosphate transaminase [Candidatus Deferrimicrobium sp.]|nr:histidinol-phosphate transaminase [Candidatus Deferrimicrobium sp.]